MALGVTLLHFHDSLNQPKKNTEGKWTRGVSHSGLAIYIKKYLKAKEELWKIKCFTMQILKKIL
jgi:hypothetical protein